MEQFLRRTLGLIDQAISEFFWLQSWGSSSNPDREIWIFYVNVGRTIGVVGINGEIHTMMGYYAVRHYYEGEALVRRVPVRKDLKPGERLTTPEEIIQHRLRLDEQFRGNHYYSSNLH